MTTRSQSGCPLLDLFKASIVNRAFIPTFRIGKALTVHGLQNMRTKVKDRLEADQAGSPPAPSIGIIA
jgi:hypothetical protein